MTDAETGCPPRRVTLTAGGVSHAGSVRTVNEDAYLITDTVCAVADGMGGHEAGEVASAIAVATLASWAEAGTIQLDDLAAPIADANARILDSAAANGTTGMGTTLVGVAAVANGGTISVVAFNVGDSRCYRLDARGLDQITVDHSQVQELVSAGEITPAEAATHPLRHVVTRALGTEPTVRPDFTVLDDGDCRILLCSDGLSGELPAATIEQVLAAGGGPEEAALDLVERALNERAVDNVTAVVVDVTYGPTNDEHETTPTAELTQLTAEITAPRANRSSPPDMPGKDAQP